MIFGVAVTSCYFFPFILADFPVANSKMILAVIGLVLLGYSLTKKGNAKIDRDFITLSLWALAVSLIAFVSMTYNHTPDNTFATYFMSMWVWLGGAYATVVLIKSVHGKVSVPLVANYLIAVCVAQCILAIVFDSVPSAREWQTQTFTGEGFMGNTDEDRLHGIGCSLDVAGFRFAAVICMAAFILCRDYNRQSSWESMLYLAAICFITVVGNMISRSTVIGTALALLYIIFVAIAKQENRKLLLQLIFFTFCAAAICIYFYNVDTAFRANIRFGFEGFFSLAQTGEWQTNSNNILKNMIVWPDSLKTWIIGDGYINNPADKSLDTFDQYYTGPIFGGYYMGTDIGYLRYIFYFGLSGLIVFALFFVESCKICINRFPAFKWMFIIILAINFIQWFKVSTDLFVVFAPFLCISAKENEKALHPVKEPSDL